MKRWLVLMVFVFLIVVVNGEVSATIVLLGFDEIRYDDAGLQLWQDNSFEYTASRLGENIISISSINFNHDGENYHGGLGSGTIEEEIICVIQGGGFVPSCLKYQRTVYFSSDFIIVGEVTGKKLKGVIRGELEDLVYNRTYGEYSIYDCKGFCHVDLSYILETEENNYESRISSLESNFTLLQSWKDIIDTTILNIWTAITGLVTQEDYDEQIEDHETRITTLEGEEDGEIFPPYLNKLSSSIRKKVVCSYAEENHLTGIEGLGWTCGMSYKTYSSGRVSARCSCKRS